MIEISNTMSVTHNPLIVELKVVEQEQIFKEGILFNSLNVFVRPMVRERLPGHVETIHCIRSHIHANSCIRCNQV